MLDRALGSGTTTIEDWLQFVFLPRPRQLAATNTQPKSGNAANRNLDGIEEANELISPADSTIKP